MTAENAKSAAQCAEQAPHGFQQVFGDAGTLKHHSHKDEQRNREQDLVGHDAEDSLRQGAENGEAHDAQRVAKERKNQRHPGERQGNLIARHQRNNDGQLP